MIRQETAGDNDHVWLVMLDRPDRRNALDVEHWRSLTQTVEAAAQKEARAIVLTGRNGAATGDAVGSGWHIQDADSRASFPGLSHSPRSSRMSTR